MPLLDLTHITLHKTFAGISCPACSGRLEVATTRKSFWSRLLRRNAKSRIRYQCLSCRKHYILTPTGL